jgi:hypothetical protein
VPLTNLTKKSHPWVWTGRCKDAFELLKQKLIQAPLLRTLDESLPYEVVTDASDLGLGGVLLQEGQPVAFESRKLNDAELNYQTTGKEMLVVVHALRVWRCYFEGDEFTGHTVHVSNTYFPDAIKPVTTASTLVGVSAALWGFRVEVPQRNKKRSQCIELKGCSGECLAFSLCCTVPSCRYCRGCCCKTPRGVSAYHHPWPGRSRIRQPGQCQSFDV